MAIIEMHNVSRIFRTGDSTVTALDNVDLSIESGTFTIILGRSGSGKSTLLNIIGLLDTMTAGSYMLDGTDISGISSSKKANYRLNRFGFVFQQFNLIRTMTVRENIELPLGYAGVEKAERNRRVDELIEAVGLSDRSDHLPSELSGGQQQRCAVARALINNPDILLADEPTGNLDRESADSLIELLLKLHEKYRMTVIMVTHDEKIAGLADCLYRMERGVLMRER